VYAIVGGFISSLLVRSAVATRSRRRGVGAYTAS
jgi:hypothetical protein